LHDLPHRFNGPRRRPHPAGKDSAATPGAWRRAVAAL